MQNDNFTRISKTEVANEKIHRDQIHESSETLQAIESFSYFCYSIRVEHEKCSEMCVWIVGFGQNLRNWDYFY
jgi:hypothetical protein